MGTYLRLQFPTLDFFHFAFYVYQPSREDKCFKRLRSLGPFRELWFPRPLIQEEDEVDEAEFVMLRRDGEIE